MTYITWGKVLLTLIFIIFLFIHRESKSYEGIRPSLQGLKIKTWRKKKKQNIVYFNG